MKKLLIKEKKGYSFRAIDIETKKTYRIFQSDFKDFKFTVGALLEVELNDENIYGDLINSMTINKEILGDSTKAKIKVNADTTKIGDLIDGVPILNFGTIWSEKGCKLAYAYFK
jgi:hypothetical protein